KGATAGEARSLEPPRVERFSSPACPPDWSHRPDRHLAATGLKKRGAAEVAEKPKEFARRSRLLF
ncbi:MAG: hypothetical protein ACO1RT_09330, partial [Planctomycetaceae bacterium]